MPSFLINGNDNIGFPDKANEIAYDNTTTGLGTGNVQSAIDSLSNSLADLTNVEDISSEFSGKIDMQLIKALKIGKIIYVDVRTGTTAIGTSNVNVVEFPIKYRPINGSYYNIVGLNSGGGNVTSYGVLSIEQADNGNGVIKMRLNTTGYYVRTSMVWLIN